MGKAKARLLRRLVIPRRKVEGEGGRGGRRRAAQKGTVPGAHFLLPAKVLTVIANYGAKNGNRSNTIDLNPYCVISTPLGYAPISNSFSMLTR